MSSPTDPAWEAAGTALVGTLRLQVRVVVAVCFVGHIILCGNHPPKMFNGCSLHLLSFLILPYHTGNIGYLTVSTSSAEKIKPANLGKVQHSPPPTEYRFGQTSTLAAGGSGGYSGNNLSQRSEFL